jgi:hypothetical protein
LNNFGDAVSVVFPIENSLNFTFPAPAPLVELPTVVGFSTPKLKSFISKCFEPAGLAEPRLWPPVPPIPTAFFGCTGLTVTLGVGTANLGLAASTALAPLADSASTASALLTTQNVEMRVMVFSPWH